MGIAIERFTADPSVLKPFICNLCNDVLFRPTNACKNEHVYCKTCIESKEHCPKCKSPVKATRNPWLSRTVEDLECRCKNYIRGCRFVGLVAEQKAHRKGESDTWEEGCQYRDYLCYVCNVRMMASEYRYHKTKVCPERVIACSNHIYGCSLVMSRKTLDRHIIEDCRYVPCGYKQNLRPYFNTPFTFHCHYVGYSILSQNHRECRQLVQNIKLEFNRLRKETQDADKRGSQAKQSLATQQQEWKAERKALLEQVEQFKSANKLAETELASAKRSLSTSSVQSTALVPMLPVKVEEETEANLPIEQSSHPSTDQTLVSTKQEEDHQEGTESGLPVAKRPRRSCAVNLHYAE